MSESIRTTLMIICCSLLAFGFVHRLRAARTGEHLDRRKEGLGIMVGVRLFGLLSIGMAAFWFWNPVALAWASVELPVAIRWIGVAVTGVGAAWLIWMYRSLGSNITDTVVTRKNATFVNDGPYRYVRNPMYVGILTLGCGLGLAEGLWAVPILTTLCFLLLAIRTKTEERFLLERFGTEYERYMQRVGRFLPRFS